MKPTPVQRTKGAAGLAQVHASYAASPAPFVGGLAPHPPSVDDLSPAALETVAEDSSAMASVYDDPARAGNRGQRL